MTAPHGREAVMEALLEAAAQLFADRAPSAVSVRDIARAAGVNQALLFRHFGDKASLVAAVVERLGSALADELDDVPDGDVERLVALLIGHRRYIDVLVRAILDPETSTMEFPSTLVRRFGYRPDGDDEAAVAIGVAVMGWFAFEPYVARAIGAEPAASHEVADRLHRLASVTRP